jgi:methyl-accepting chemotaxis protein
MEASQAVTLDSDTPKNSEKANNAPPSGGFRLDNLRISIRMAMVLALPIAATLWLGGVAIFDARHEVVEQQKLQTLAVVAQKISGTVHELQKERGMSAGFINSKGQSFSSELPGQRGATNDAHKSMTSALKNIDAATYGTQMVKLVSAAQSALGNLQSMRSRVSRLQATVPQMAKYYTPTIAKLLSIVEFMGSLSHNAEVSNAIATYTAFLQGKERAGIERAMGAAGFGAGQFAPPVYQNFIGLIAAQDSFFAVFRKHAQADQITYYNQTLTGPAVDGVNRMRKIARDSVSSGNTGGITGKQWFATITSKIELMKKVEDRIAGDLVTLTDNLRAHANTVFWTDIGVVGGLTAVTLLLAFYMVRGITRPMTRLADATKRLADGDTATEITLRESGDEVGTLVKATKVFRENLIQNEHLQAEQREAEKREAEEESRRAEEKRTAEARTEEEKRAADAKAEAARKQAMIEMADNFEKSVMGVVESLSSAATEMQSSAETMSATADQTNQQATAVAAASEEATVNVQTVASSAEELSASIEEISRQVTQSNQIAQSAVDEAQQTNEKVEGLAEAAQKIGDVVSLINDIASQTNLLALNATIEAARAGDAGKGFAVVASEVKSLATQTGKATEEIGAQITAIQGATGEAVQAIQAIGSTIGQLGEIATSVASAVDQQGSATREIASSVQQAAAGTQEVSGNIAQVTQAASETQASSGQMLGAAKELAQQGNVLRTEVDKFLQEVRAA